ncbi:MAG: DUF6712 family protein [Bacteroidota bacterium]
MEHLFKDFEEISYFTGQSGSYDLKFYKRHLEYAVRYKLRPYIGEPFYKELVQFYEEGKEEELVKLAQSVVAHFAADHHVPRNEAKDTAEGILRLEPTGLKSAYRDQVGRLSISYEEDGYRDLEELLRLLEERCKADSEVFPKFWRHFKLHEPKWFIANTKEFDHIINIKESRKRFMELHPYLVEAHEDLSIILGNEFYENLLQQHRNKEYGTYTQPLIRWCTAFIAHQAYAVSLQRSYGEHTEDGTLELTASNSKHHGKQTADDTKRDALIEWHKGKAKEARQEILEELHDKPENFPLFKQTQRADLPLQLRNTSENKVVSL